MSQERQQKIALVKKTQSSDWISCQSITQNLISAYKRSFGDKVTDFQLTDPCDLYQCFQLIEFLAKQRFTVICWVDHYPHPATFIKALATYQKLNDPKDWQPALNFHIFGDFSLHAPLWIECQDELKNFPTLFTCASHAQASFVSQFLNIDQTALFTFPCDSQAFYFSELERTSARVELGLEEGEPALLYSGRISRQKNVIELLLSFDSIASHLSPCPTLILAGDFDDLNIPFIGHHSDAGHYFQSLNETLAQCKNSFKVKLLGQLAHQDLRKVYNAADLYISLSTHNDEDYGMCPAEAALCGLPMILSAWGGYHSFARHLGQTCQLLGVEQKGKRILPNLSELQKKLMTHDFSHDSASREDFSKRSIKTLSTENLAQKLCELPIFNQKTEKFRGFNQSFEKFAASFTISPRAPFRNSQGEYSADYFDFYQPYFDPERKK
jgi:glycosyltransferase involved in cell wall biosynthesis